MTDRAHPQRRRVGAFGSRSGEPSELWWAVVSVTRTRLRSSGRHSRSKPQERLRGLPELAAAVRSDGRPKLKSGWLAVTREQPNAHYNPPEQKREEGEER
jgi:hypothetical protein